MTRHQNLSRPLVGVVGPWLHNKGDVLMLRAVREHLTGIDVGAPVEFWHGGIPLDQVVRVARRPKIPEIASAARRMRARELAWMGAKWAALSLPSGLGARLSGHVSADRLTGLLDCSGYAYGDVWTTRRIVERRKYYRELRRRGIGIAVLPQAFGPFEREDMAEESRALLDLCDLVYARDKDSLAHLQGLGLAKGVKLRLAPDITNLVEGVVPADAGEWRNRVCIVPNARMLDRTSDEHGKTYLDFMLAMVATIRDLGCEPWLVLHESNDAELASHINSKLGEPLPLLDADAVETKGIFAASRAVVASRYHALISSLSSGTPVMAMSWSHKYERLFEEYGHETYLMDPGAGEIEWKARLADLVCDPVRAGIVERLRAHAEHERQRVREMWIEVDFVLAVPHRI